MKQRGFKSQKVNKGKKISPHKSSDISSQKQRPIFGLEFLTRDFCLSKCEKHEKAQFVDKLHKLSQLTWAEILSTSRTGMGHEKIYRDKIKVGIPPHITDDVVFLAFRCIGKAPMVGYRSERVFNIVWIDRDFTLYDHGS